MLSKQANHDLLSSNEFYDHMSLVYDETKLRRKSYLEALQNLVIASLSKRSIEGAKILDIGCGDGLRTEEIGSALKSDILGIDSSNKMVDIAKNHGVVTKNIDIADKNAMSSLNNFDAVTMLWNVLGHIPANSRLAALKNIRRSLEQNGLFIIDVNNLLNTDEYGAQAVSQNKKAITERSTEVGRGDFITSVTVAGVEYFTSTHIFYEEEIRSLLQEAGFRVEEVQYINYKSGKLTTVDKGQLFITSRIRGKS